MTPAPAALLNGQPCEHLPLTHRGLHYGDGVFRTLKVVQGHIQGRSLQWQVLAKDAAWLGLPMPDAALLDEESQQMCRGVRSGVLKLMLLRSGAGRGYAPPTASEPDRLWLRYAMPPLPTSVVLGFSHVPLSEGVLHGVKHLNRLEQVLAAGSMPLGCDEALMSVGEDDWRCGTKSTVFWREAGLWFTPAQPAIEGYSYHRYTAEPSLLNRERLLAAEVVCIANSVMGLLPVRACEGRVWSEKSWLLAQSLPDSQTAVVT